MTRWRQTYQTARRDLDRLSRQTARELESLVIDLRRDIQSRLIQVGDPTAPFTTRLLPGVADSLDNSLERLRRSADQTLQAGLSEAFDLGVRLTGNALGKVGVGVAFPQVAPAVLVSLGSKATDVITELVADLRADIDKVLNRGALGLRSMTDVIAELGDVLRTSELRLGRRARIRSAFRAEAIARTELGTVFSAAQQAAGEQLGEILPDLRKRWVTVLKDRRGHLKAERQYAPGGAVGPIPPKASFRVEDFSRIGRTRFVTLDNRVVKLDKAKTRRRGRVITDFMLHPRDPSASAGNRVNCSCFVMDVLPDLDKAAQRSMGVVSA